MKLNPFISVLCLIVAMVVISTMVAPAGLASREPANRRALTPMIAGRPVRHTRNQSGGPEPQRESISRGETGELVELVLPQRSDLTTGLTEAVQAPQQEREVATPQVIQMVGPVSQDQDLRVLARVPLNRQNQEQEEEERRLTRHPPTSKTVLQAQSDPVQPVRLPAFAVAMPTPSLTFDGITSATSGCGCTPPDPIGDVGPNHYVQAVNSSFQIFSKSGGSLAGPTSFNSFFSAMGAGTPCGAGQNAGDPGVLYDHMADRWVISDIAFPSFPGTSFYQCLAVSKTADPVAGGWWLYALQVDPANPTFLGDYPKFGIWPDAYYFSVNLFSNNTTFNGVRVFALPRSAMMNGTGAPNPGAIAFTVTPANLGDIYSLLPATFRSGSLPPAGAAEYFMAINSSATAGTVENQVFTWRFHTDFTTPANSTFGVGAGHTPDGAVTVNNFVDAFTASTFLIVPQTGTSSLLDSLGDKLMYPLVYQNLSGAESLYVSHTVNNNQGGTGPTAIRWYKFNVTGGTIPAAPAQQQTFNNGADGLWRFMPSLTVDAQGNLAIGYSQSSGTTEPAIAYAGRLAADPPNTLAQGEAILSASGGHQTSLAGRWGDYTSTSIDPSNNCTIWHTNEYYSTTSTSSWRTRIGNFSLPGCSLPAIPTVPVSLPNVTGATNGSTVTIPVTVSDLSGLGVRAYDLQVTFNPSVLQPSATPYDITGTLSSGMFITPNATNSGHLIISAFQASDLSGSGTLLNLKFTVVGTAGQSTPLTFENYTDPNTLVHAGFRFNAGNPLASTTNGSLSVNSAPTIVASPVTRQAGSPISNSTIATVNDTESGASGVTVTVTSGNPSNGVTVSNIVNTSGTVSADVVAACGATNASFTLTATDGAGATATATLSVTVNPNTAPTLVYSTPQSVIFGGSLNVTPTTANDNGSITGYSVQSVVPALTTAPTVNASGVVSVTNAQPSGSHVITIRATDNCGLTNDAQFTLDVGAMPSFAINDVTMSEGNSGTASFTFNVTKTGSTALNATVDYLTVDGTAVSPSDFSAITTTTLTFLPADTTKQVTVFVNGDTTFEPDEAFTVHLLNPGSATIGDADGTGTITNDDTQPTISINDVTVTEGNSGTTTGGFTVSLSNASSQTITVNYATADNTATAGSDYVSTSGTLTFTTGQTSQPVNVTVNGDTTFESTETFNVNLTLPTNATIADSQGVGTITNDDTQPTISINDVSVTEGNSGTTTAGFTVSLSNASSQTITVNYATADNTATEGSDYVSTSGTLTFTTGQTSQPVNVTVNGDTTFESTETFNVNLTLPTNATIADSQGVGTITNDDTQPTISINDVSVTEGNSGTTTAGFTVSLSNASSQTITVNYATADNTATAGSDYVSTSGTLTFTTGQTSQPVNVTVNGDTTFESTETFNVNLTLPTNATIADSQGVGTITNDDAPLISGHVTYVDTVTPGKNVTMTLTANAFTTQTTTTDANGNYTFASVPFGNDYTVTPSKTGDVNGIESLDASDTARYVAGLTVPSTNQQIAADSDGDAILTSFDASLIARFVVGLPNAGNVGTWKFIPASRFYPALSSNQTNQNFSAILVGDTGGNWLPSLASGDWLSTSTNFTDASPLNVATPGISPAVTVPVSLLNVAGAGSGSIVTIPVTVSDLSGLGVRAYDLHLSFDPAVLQPLATPYDTTGTLSSGMFITPNATNSGHLIISAFQATDLSGPGTLLNLKFTVVGTAGQSTLLTFEDYADPNTLNHAGFRFNAGNPSAITTNAWLQVDGGNATNGNISGTITDATGAPVSGTMIALSGAQSREAITDANGNYSFAGVDVNGFYTVTPSRANYTFGPANRSFRMLGIHTEASFTATANGSDLNPLDTTGFFLRQHYLDFLNREPDPNGFNFWLHQIDNCAPAFQCTESARINVSAAFFLSIEFEGTGYLVERLYKAAYGDATGTSTLGGTHQLSVPVVRFNEFLRDSQVIGRGVVVNQAGWERALESNKETFTAEFVQRSRFTAAFPASMSATEFVDALNRNAGNPLSPAERNQLINDLVTNARTRAQVLRAVAEDPDLDHAEFNRTFVLMQYFGYLRRDPNNSPDTDYTGYDFWLAKLNRFNGSFVDAEMVKAFLLSSEFRRRFR